MHVFTEPITKSLPICVKYAIFLVLHFLTDECGEFVTVIKGWQSNIELRVICVLLLKDLMRLDN